MKAVPLYRFFHRPDVGAANTSRIGREVWGLQSS
jgi:hypothetical protein